jgi:serine/threonine-protein kinase RsbW
VEQSIELEIPAQPEFVGIARMAVSALASMRPGLPYDRIDDLRIVVSEACTSAIEAVAGGGKGGRIRLVCLDGAERLEVRVGTDEASFSPVMVEDPALTDGEADDLRMSLIRALVDEVEVVSAGSELRLVVLRQLN